MSPVDGQIKTAARKSRRFYYLSTKTSDDNNVAAWVGMSAANPNTDLTNSLRDYALLLPIALRRSPQ